MSLAKILAPLAGSPRDAIVLATAFAAARPFKAHVEALFVRPDPVESMPLYGESMSSAVVQEIMDVSKEAAGKASQSARKMLDAAAHEAQVTVVAAPRAARHGHDVLRRDPGQPRRLRRTGSQALRPRRIRLAQGRRSSRYPRSLRGDDDRDRASDPGQRPAAHAGLCKKDFGRMEREHGFRPRRYRGAALSEAGRVGRDPHRQAARRRSHPVRRLESLSAAAAESPRPNGNSMPAPGRSPRCCWKACVKAVPACSWRAAMAAAGCGKCSESVRRGVSWRRRTFPVFWFTE